MNLDGRYVLFAWSKYIIKGGLNDNCGLFKTPVYALDFFIHSDHCKFMEYYQIVDIDTLSIVSEGERDDRKNIHNYKT